MLTSTRRLSRLAFVLAAPLLLSGRAPVGDASTTAEHAARDAALPILEAAALEFTVPVDLLKAYAFVHTRFTVPEATGTPATAHVFGVMGLHDGRGPGGFRNQVATAARLLGVSEDEVKTDLEANVRGTAALLRAEASRLRIVGESAEDWARVVERVSALPSRRGDPLAARRSEACRVLRVLAEGHEADGVSIVARPVRLDGSCSEGEGSAYHDPSVGRGRRAVAEKAPTPRATRQPSSPASALAAPAAAPPVLMWSYGGAIGGWHCTQWREDADPHTWQDNFLCSNLDIGMRWSYAGPIPGMRCTAITEGADPHTWQDNFLCVPSSSPVSFSWSSAGPVGSNACVQVNEPADPYTWDDNFLCGSGFDVQIDLVDHFFHDNPQALNIQRITGGGEQQVRAYRANTGYPNGFHVTKIYDFTTGKAPLYVEWYYDDSWIYMVRDTSWQEVNWCTASDGRRHDTLFELWEAGAGRAGARTYPRFMVLNKATYNVPSAKIVARFEEGPQRCQVCDSPVDGDSGARSIRAVFLPWKTFSLTGRLVPGVVDLQVLSGAGQGEHSYLHKVLGDLGYEDLSGFQSHYKESQNFPLEIDESRRCTGGGSPGCGRLGSGAALGRGQAVQACNGAATLVHQLDGNVVVYDRAGALWSSGTPGRATTAFVMQLDGNLVLYNGGAPLWNSGTWNNPGATALIQDDCNFVVENAAGRALWASNRRCR